MKTSQEPMPLSRFRTAFGALWLVVIVVQAFPALAADMPPAKLYATSCLACHGADGRGKAMREAMPAIPDFTDASWQASRKNVQLRISILDGKGQFMPSLRDKLTQENAKQLVSLVRQFGKEK